MPTGYTAAIADDITFNDFAMQCARAMGAPIPERFEPSDYHTKKMDEANVTIERLRGMTEAEADQAASAEYDAAIAAQAAAIIRNDTLREKYNAMLAKVEAWEPPSADHAGFKKFMVEQITSSIGFDCDNRYYRDLTHTKLTGADWLAQEEAKVRKDIAYHEAENTKEIERTEGRNRWVKELRDSLKGSNVQIEGLVATEKEMNQEDFEDLPQDEFEELLIDLLMEEHGKTVDEANDLLDANPMLVARGILEGRSSARPIAMAMTMSPNAELNGLAPREDNK